MRKEGKMFNSVIKNESITDYIKSVIMYTLFSDADQNNEYKIEQVDDGFLFIPIYPITYVIDEKFYNKLFTILNIALTPMYTLVRPLTMQVVTFNGKNASESRALFLPALKGKPQRLRGTVEELLKLENKIQEIPIMDSISWNLRYPHAIVTGVSGSGKSYFMRYLFIVCSSIGETIAVDPKKSDLARLAKEKGSNEIVTPSFNGSDDNTSFGIGGKFSQKVVNTLKRVESEMYRRQGELYRLTRKVSTDFREIGLKPIFVFIDEVAALMTGTSKKVKTDLQETLTRLVVLGREAGIYLVLSMQSARAEYLPTIVRDNISLRVQLGRINSENTRFLFPELNEMPIVPIGGKGSGILSIAGDSRYSGIEPILTPTILD